MNLDQFDGMHSRATKLLYQEYNVFLGYSCSPVVDRWAANYLQPKLEGKPVRAQFALAMSDWLINLKPPWQQRTLSARKHRLLKEQIPLLFELVISIQYLHNQILDGKAGVTNRMRIADNVLLANLLKEQLYRYIDDEVPTSYRKLVTTYIRQCFEWVDIGQQIERQSNNYAQMHQYELHKVLPPALRKEIDLEAVQAFIDKTKHTLPNFLHSELDHYFHRVYLTCAALFVKMTQLLGGILRVLTTQLQAPLQFSVCYGIMRQLVNDNADWVTNEEQLHTQEKNTADAFSDLRNKTLTLPLFFWLAEKHSPECVIEQLLNDQRTWTPELQNAVFTEILNSHALFRSVQHTRILAELALAFLPNTHTDLAKSCEIAHWNKFLFPVLRHPTYKGFRRSPAHRSTKKLIKQLRRARQQESVSTSALGQWLSWFKATYAPPTVPSPARKAIWLLRREMYVLQ